MGKSHLHVYVHDHVCLLFSSLSERVSHWLHHWSMVRVCVCVYVYVCVCVGVYTSEDVRMCVCVIYMCVFVCVVMSMWQYGCRSLK